MLTRWDEWYSEDNLKKDPRILIAPASKCSEIAGRAFKMQGKQRILDLGCGIGRDSFSLDKQGLSVFGVDASRNAVKVALESRSHRSAKTQFLNADARSLPFINGSFEGVYCFGLLHEFTSDEKEENVWRVISEARRLLEERGLFVLAVAAGDPQAGLPQVQLFSQQMFEQAMTGWHILELRSYDDIGCTNRTDYHIWYGLFQK
jgi:SAM-dependent methyltransferase